MGPADMSQRRGLSLGWLLLTANCLGLAQCSAAAQPEMAESFLADVQPRRQLLVDWKVCKTPELMSVVYNVTRNCPTCLYKPPLEELVRSDCRAACAADARCKCAIYKKIPPTRCFFYDVPCTSPAMHLKRDPTATFDAIFKCPPRSAPVPRLPPPMKRPPSSPPPMKRPPPPMKQHPPPARSPPPPSGPHCSHGPGSYQWPVAAAAVGVTRGYLENGLRKICTCSPGQPPYWKCTQSSDQSSGYTVDYNKQQVSPSATGFSITMSPGWNGARIKTAWAAKSAMYCAQIKLPAGLNPSGVFAFYASSGEPWNRATAKWDELDMEFLLMQNEQLWVNTWHDGQVVEGEEGFKPLPFGPNGAWHKYCFDWDLKAQQAKWYVDNKLFHQYKMDGSWVKPLFVYFSFWGMNNPWCGATNWYVTRTTNVADMAYEIRS